MSCSGSGKPRRSSGGESDLDGHAWAGDGAVQVYADLVDGDITALLLEHACPSRSDSPPDDLRGLPEPAQDLVVAGLLRRLWSVQPANKEFRPLTEMCALWVADIGATRNDKNDDPQSALDPGMVRDGLALWHDLPANADRHVLLATDLHAGNIMAADREPWLVIDPKPYVGDPTYDVLQHLLNCPTRLHADPVALCKRLADSCDLDRDRVQHWLFARCVVESIGSAPTWPELAQVAVMLAP